MGCVCVCVYVHACMSSFIPSALSQQVLLSSDDRSGWVETINIQLFWNSLSLKYSGAQLSLWEDFVRVYLAIKRWHLWRVSHCSYNQRCARYYLWIWPVWTLVLQFAYVIWLTEHIYLHMYIFVHILLITNFCFLADRKRQMCLCTVNTNPFWPKKLSR